MTADTLRRCARCTERKSLTEFRRDSRGYWRSLCIGCGNAYKNGKPRTVNGYWRSVAPDTPSSATPA